MVQLMGHRQTKGPVTVRQHLNYRATSRLHSFLLKCSKQTFISQERNGGVSTAVKAGLRARAPLLRSDVLSAEKDGFASSTGMESEGPFC